MAYKPNLLAVADGGTGASTAANARTNLGITNVATQSVTQFDVLVGGAANAISSIGPGTAGQILQSGGAAANPAYSSATYPAATTINQILYSSSTSVVSGLATANSAVLTTTLSGVPQLLALTDGQIIIGSTAGAPAAATITAGAGIAITNSSNAISIAVVAQGFTWNNVTATSASMAKENGYQTNNVGLVTLTLPSTASSTFGDRIAVMGLGAGGWIIAQLAGQQIQFGSIGSTVGVGGSVASTNRYDSCELVYTTTAGLWILMQATGNLTIT